ncbi:MAG: ABC transporter permease [Lachnospiraceae bacterium]|nr:ABC transporter permease [Lachnospiraceae bacterium]
MDKILGKRSALAGPYVIWAVGFTVIPLLVIIKYALFDRSGAFTLSNILAIFDPVHLRALVFSLEIALGCTAICIILAYPLVLAISRLRFARSGFMLVILILPMWMNFILKLLAWQMILSSNGVLNMIISALGITGFDISNTPLSIMIGVIYEYFPYMVLPVFDAVVAIDADVIEAARDLGAKKSTVFWKIIFPLSLPGLMSGITMVFVPSMTSFVTADILGGGKLQLVGNIIEQEFIQSMNWNLGSGLSVALMIFILISMTFTVNRNEREEEEAW